MIPFGGLLQHVPFELSTAAPQLTDDVDLHDCQRLLHQRGGRRVWTLPTEQTQKHHYTQLFSFSPQLELCETLYWWDFCLCDRSASEHIVTFQLQVMEPVEKVLGKNSNEWAGKAERQRNKE